MIVVDSSVVIAIVRREAEADAFSAILDRSERSAMSAVSAVETNMVIAGRRLDADPARVAALLETLGIAVSDVTASQADLAIDAFLQFGKGRHRAALNLADCFAYALAKSHEAPLLFKGDGFAQTDVTAAWRAES
jgi:ribonuclease VapC